ncbi:hypothetical protein CCAX7_44010 [Capsulimonas corticalis]|uniref:Uncharacterized protein n=1 Tax=Capsulimonas corticalis TaxID=2219043 RepID=A0A402CX90_9BACT|nr:hypothetical protein [Capsulimonas corticalis]BDI32350.1 hypothetical protein CCAX7_44010 [Capsulimonas corticalis]
MLDSIFGPIAHSGAEPQPLAYVVLFESSIALNVDDFRRHLRAYDPETQFAEVESLDAPADSGTFAGRVKWGVHAVDMVGFDAPAPKSVLDRCLPPAHYGEPLKRQAYAHKANMLLIHRGPEVDPMSRCVALAAIAGVLELMGAIVVLSEAAQTSLPAGVFSPRSVAASRVEHLRRLPIPLFYVGCVKYNLPNTPKIWMRTYGADFFGAPDLAMLTAGHGVAQQTMDRFDAILGYMIGQKTVVQDGHTMQVGQENLRFRKPAASDPQDGSDGPFLVVETIAASEINRPADRVTSRELTIQELTNMRSVAQRAILGFTEVTLGSPPESIVRAIDQEVRRVRKQQSSLLGKLMDRSPKVDPAAMAIGIGALWGDQLVSRFRWEWAHVTRAGKRGFAVASPDRSIAIYPSDYLRRCLSSPDLECAVASSFQRIASGSVPHVAPNSYFDILA